jgi:asparagine synthase (glutamine-hydrolysing)
MLLKDYPTFHQALPYRFQAFPLKAQLYSDGYKEILNQQRGFLPFFFNPDKIAHRSLIDQALYIETKMRLLNLTLPLADKMSMANSVELRPTFLDHDLVNFIFRIPDKLKIKTLCEKYILKRSMQGFLPDEVCHRKKQPLQPPGKWFVGAARELIFDFLSDEMVRKKGYFNPSFVSKILKAFRNGSKTDYSGVIIVAFFIHLWDEIFFGGDEFF